MLAQTIEGKIPENPTFVPTPKYRNFWGFHPQNPQNCDCPRPQSFPKTFRKSLPILVPEFWGFSGIFLPENPRCAECPHPRPRNIGEIVKISGIPRKSPISVNAAYKKIRVSLGSNQQKKRSEPCCSSQGAEKRTKPCRYSQGAEKRTEPLLSLNGSDNDSNSRNIKSIITITISCTMF